ncbi:MAG: ATP-dependent Clp protease adapter ClpS [Candidatus Magnetoovum sp. WYHC-5]|nr:ATP-dependent Clp protease adapter ClpS [Candidatus Magnetoovum sp. WYHC-5]
MSIEGPGFKELIEQKTYQKLKPPVMYKVILLNDDYTTMEFVVYVLEDVFHKNNDEANQIMMLVHKKGSGLCGIYTKDIAETRIKRVNELAIQHDFPLKCIMEKD